MVHQRRSERGRNPPAPELTIWPVGQAVKTAASHAVNVGSNPARVTSRKARQRKLPRNIEEAEVEAKASKLVLITVRVHPFPSRTRKLSSLVPTILGWKRPGTIGRRQHKYSSIAQPVEHATVNRRVVGSSPTWGAKEKSERVCVRTFCVNML